MVVVVEAVVLIFDGYIKRDRRSGDPRAYEIVFLLDKRQPKPDRAPMACSSSILRCCWTSCSYISYSMNWQVRKNSIFSLNSSIWILAGSSCRTTQSDVKVLLHVEESSDPILRDQLLYVGDPISLHSSKNPGPKWPQLVGVVEDGAVEIRIAVQVPKKLREMPVSFGCLSEDDVRDDGPPLACLNERPEGVAIKLEEGSFNGQVGRANDNENHVQYRSGSVEPSNLIQSPGVQCLRSKAEQLPGWALFKRWQGKQGASVAAIITNWRFISDFVEEYKNKPFSASGTVTAPGLVIMSDIYEVLHIKETKKWEATKATKILNDYGPGGSKEDPELVQFLAINSNNGEFGVEGLFKRLCQVEKDGMQSRALYDH
ncbi:hypothetical protein C8J56DRAFT_1046106 [Mycena floridula]|nr:hypothetical protein C8J56DRAFT_1046106 [Mycena floridula]